MTTDAQLQHDVRNQLDRELQLGAARIGVNVSDGVIVLTGQVDTGPQCSAAQRAARRVAGSHTVISRIRRAAIDPAAILSEIRRIRHQVAIEKSTAECIAGRVGDVKAVRNEITVRPRVHAPTGAS